MNLHRSERDYYVVDLVTDPVLAGDWEASFDGGATWATGTLGLTGWTWLVAGPQYDAAAVGQSAGDTDGTVKTSPCTPLLRIKDNPVTAIQHGPVIELYS